MIGEGALVLFQSFTFYLLIYVILSLSMNLEYGLTGVPNLGKVLFFFVGAITSTVITVNVYDSILGTEDPLSALAAARRTELAASNPLLAVGVFVLSLISSSLVAGVLGFVASYPALALKGSMLSITLLIFGEAARVFVRTYQPLVGGVFGISGISNPFVFLRNPPLGMTLYVALTGAIAIFTYLLVERLTNSPFGRLMKAVRDDELAAYSLGKDVPRVRGQVLFIGSAIAGAAGSLYTFYSQSIFPDDYVPALTFLVLTMTILGGLANNVGAVVGALVLAVFERFSQASTLAVFGITVGFDISYLRYAVMGILIVTVLLYRPQGLIPEKPVKTELYDVVAARGRRSSRAGS
ncbi:MAG: branched-chain amino acid ABC transporter permease [Thaumarchaeota archaeon]|nr:branched-chain amino acid ABC transporter permease [Candidatus Calditenuaceae archaeon]MDW8041929.1 branched-chain amino acid ABC transporter permease [Nitrososphaerota archaeon]